jgi:predicted deacylase
MVKTTYNGFNSKGLNILLTAGVHGNEFTPVYAMMQIVKESLFSDLEIFNKINKLTILNGINDIGLKLNQRNYDRKSTQDLNRMFSFENTDIRDEIKNYLDETDILIDLHSSKNSTEFALIDFNENLNSLVEWCKMSDVPFGTRYSNGTTLKRYIQDKDGISLTIEINGLSEVYRDSAIKSIEIIKKLLNNFDKFKLQKQIPVYDTIKEIYSYKSGFVEYLVSPGSYIEKDSVVANVFDLKGKPILEVKSNYSGLVLVQGSDFVDESDLIYIIQNQTNVI